MTRWYSINHNGDYKEYVSFEHAKESSVITVVTEVKTSYKSHAGYINLAYEYNFYQNHEESMIIKLGKYQINEVKTFSSVNNYDKEIIYAVFADKDGIRIEPTQSFGRRIEGISNAIKFLIELNKFENYENYSLSKQVQNLEKRISELEKLSSGFKTIIEQLNNIAPSQ
ncbi:hypothetical protein [Hymenobacter weizhouensis]|uniref:hypothetical protein n=1 Tax=Hymenobacter sp. YIM 151500-1 TaxID=2987689 RepID=UPI00222785B4|nr:hypothetical protein [Hymenobacter sp. YIM 151500-1]UYZ61638.1 hypothetical protein OIS53_11550 [Hymenobacter sp. YIM 151500-1]